MKKHLDFIVIGAQKSGTTSLFRYLRKHPAIFLPPAKEIPFFSEDVYFEHGFEWFLTEFFGSADPNHLWGTVTPSYMANLDSAKRIHDTIPNVKLVAILRNPIHRAMSHYQMTYKRGIEDRQLTVALDNLLEPEHIISARKIRSFTVESEKCCYLAWGEYGRIIQYYRQFFPKNQIHILFYDDLAARPGYTLDSVLSFLGLKAGFRPSNLGKQYFKGGSRNRIPRLTRMAEMVSVGLPFRYRSALMLWLEVVNTVPEEINDVCLSVDLRRKLRDFYRPDISLFEKISGMKTPWSEFL